MEVKFYDIFCEGELIGKVIDYNRILIDTLRDMDAEITVTDMQSNTPPFYDCKCGWRGVIWDCEQSKMTGELYCPNCKK